jgi:diguanylate cyclase (GGDEF)-like protein
MILERTRVTDSGQEKLEDLKQRTRSCLIVIHGTHLGKKYDLELPELIIGRNDDADIVIHEDNVSRKHSKIIQRGDKVIIEDLDSTNGTFVNTKKTKTTKLKDGDLVLIGNTILKFISRGNIENAYHEEIYRLATLDGLTQCYNRKFFIEKLSNEFSRAQRYKRDLALVIFDLDKFKLINDMHGHQAGDFVLKKVASIIMRNLRKEDFLGRYGGEEFAIILPETNLNKSYALADKLRQLIAGVKFKYNNKELTITMSGGIASLEGNLINYNDLIELADKALYIAKNKGKNLIIKAS